MIVIFISFHFDAEKIKKEKFTWMTRAMLDFSRPKVALRETCNCNFSQQAYVVMQSLLLFDFTQFTFPVLRFHMKNIFFCYFFFDSIYKFTG